MNMLELPAIANPTTPAAGTLDIYARSVAGRIVPKWTPPSGLDTPFQAAIWGNQVILFTPYSGTTVTPNGFGAIWAKGGSLGTTSTPTLSSSSPTFLNSMRRFRHASVITTTNQACGVINIAAASQQFWRGNAAGLGGYFAFFRFGIGAWTAGNRIFVGLTNATSEACVTGDTLSNNSVGLHRISTDTSNALYFSVRDGSTTNRIPISGATIAAGGVFDLYIFVKPNDGTVNFRLDQLDNGSGSAPGTLIDSSTTTNVPVSTAFLGVQAEMSNGANTPVNSAILDVNRIYIESDH